MADGQIADILLNLLNIDKLKRLNAEEQLQYLKAQSPPLLMCSLTEILFDPISSNLKSLSLVLLKQYVHLFWLQIDISSQEFIKNKLLISLHSFSNADLLKKCCDVISEIAIQKHKTPNNNNSSNILPIILNNLFSDNNNLIFSSFQILFTIYPYNIEDLTQFQENLYTAYSQHLENPNIEIISICIQSLTLTISIINTSESMSYASLLQKILQAILNVCLKSQYLGEICLKSLRDLAETEPLYFKSQIMSCFNFADILCKQSIGLPCKYICIDFITLLVEEYAQIIRNKKTVVEGLFVLFMRNIIESLSLGGEKDEIDYEKRFLILLQKVAGPVKNLLFEVVLEYLRGVEKGFEWQILYVAINCLARISKDFSDTEKLEIGFVYFVKMASSQVPQVKWACFKALKMIFKYFPKHFGLKFSETIITTLSSGLCEENIQVLEMILKATRAFFEYSEGRIHNKHINSIVISICLLLLRKDLTAKVFNVLESIIEVYRKKLRVYFDELFQKTLEITQSTKDSSTKAAGLGCLLSLRKTLKRCEFKIYAPLYVNLLKNMDQDPSTDFFKIHILNSWKILAKELNSELKDHIEHIVPVLLLYIQKFYNNDIEEHLETLIGIIEATSGDFLAYLPTASELFVFLISQNPSDSGKVMVSSLAAALVKVVKSTYNKDIQASICLYSKGFVSAIWGICANENDVNVLMDIFENLREIIHVTEMEFLSKDEVSQIGRFIVEVLEHERGNKSSEDYENALKVSSRVLSTLFKTHIANSITLLEYVYKNIIGKYLEDPNNDKEHIFSIEILSSIIETTGNELSQQRTKEIIETLLFCIDRPSQAIKITVIDSLVKFFINIKSEIILEFIPGIMGGLEKCMNCQDKSITLAKENAKIAVGTLLKYHKNCIKIEIIIPWWIGFLPITKNIAKAREMHDFLADLITNEAPVLANSINIVRFFMNIVQTDMCSVNTIPKVQKIVEMYLQKHDRQLFVDTLPETILEKLCRHL